MLNGNWIGFTDHAQTMVATLKEARSQEIVPYEVSIVRDIVQK